jgi:hypothetical protein
MESWIILGFFVMMDCYQYGFNLPGMQDHLIFMDISDLQQLIHLTHHGYFLGIFHDGLLRFKLQIFMRNQYKPTTLVVYVVSCWQGTPSWWGANLDLRPYQSLVTTPRPI